MVKIYDNKQVGRQSLNAPYANAESFGGGFGRTLQQAAQGFSTTANQLFDIAKERKSEYDTLKVSDADTALADASSELLNGNIYLRKGQNAIGSSKEFEEAFDKKVNELSEKLENGDQLRSFAKIAKRRKEMYLNSTRTFEREQFQRYKEESTQSAVDNAIEEALANYTNDNLVQMSFNKGLAAVKANYLGQGEIAVQKERQYKSSFYKPMIAKMSVEDSEKAQSFYLAHKDDIAASEHEAIEQMLYGDALKQKSVKNADTLWASGKTEREQLEEAQKIKNIDERDMTINRIKSRWSDKRHLDDAEKKEKQQKQWEQFTKSQSAEEALDILSTVSDPQFRRSLENEYGYRWLGMAKPNSYQRQKGLTLQANHNKLTADLDAAIQAGFVPDSIVKRIVEISDEKVRDAYINYNSKGGLIETDSNTYVMLADLAQRDQSNFASIDLNHYIDRLSAADRAYLQAIQEDIQSTGMSEAGNGKYTEFLSTNDHVKRYMKLLGIEEKDEAEEYYKAKMRLESAVNELEQNKYDGKKKATTDDINTIILRLAGDFKERNWIFDNDVKLRQFAGEPVEKRAKVYQPFENIDGDDLSSINIFLAEKGISGDPTKNSNLKKLYEGLFPAILAGDRETIDFLILDYKGRK